PGAPGRSRRGDPVARCPRCSRQGRQGHGLRPGPPPSAKGAGLAMRSMRRASLGGVSEPSVAASRAPPGAGRPAVLRWRLEPRLMARACLTLLGGFEARLDDGTSLGLPTHKYKALLAFLAMPPGQAHPRDKLVALLWGELPREQGRAALRQALWALRKTLDGGPPHALRLEDDTVGLEPGVVRVDVTEFERAARSGDAPALARAADLYRGEFLTGIAPREAPFEEWLIVERERLAELAVDALARLLV